jgi:hypothetical protein
MRHSVGPRRANGEQPRPRSRRAAAAAGLVSGAGLAALLGVLALLIAAPGASAPSRAPQAVLDATHLPPLLRLPDERVELRYDVHCAAAGEPPDDVACDATGTVFLAESGSSAYEGIPLRIDPDTVEGRYVAVVPSSLAARKTGFDYFAVFRSASAGLTSTLPAGGSQAPQPSVPLLRPVEVELGRHIFGEARRADARVAEARWGDGPGEAGLEQGRNLPPIGASSFDVGRDGTVHLLDQAHRRILRWSPGAVAPESVPAAIDNRLADLAVADDGSLRVLELARAGEKPLLRTLDRAGRDRGAAALAERTASQLRLAGDRALVLQQPSGQWMSAEAGGRALGPSEQKGSGRAGRLVPGHGEVVVLRVGNEIRAAVVGKSGVRQSWRVTSETPVAELQLAEPVGRRLVLVAHVYSDARDEFVVLVLGPSGVVQRFSVTPEAWAETAPLSRFRLRGSSLYRLGSTPAGVFVDRFDLEVS